MEAGNILHERLKASSITKTPVVVRGKAAMKRVAVSATMVGETDVVMWVVMMRVKVVCINVDGGGGWCPLEGHRRRQ